MSGHNGIDTVLPEQAPEFDADGKAHGILGQGLSYDLDRTTRSVTVTGGNGHTIAALQDGADAGYLTYPGKSLPVGRLHKDGSFEIYRDQLAGMVNAAKSSNSGASLAPPLNDWTGSYPEVFGQNVSRATAAPRPSSQPLAMTDGPASPILSTPIDPDAGKPTMLVTPAQESKPNVLVTPIAEPTPDILSTPIAPDQSHTEHVPISDGLDDLNVMEARENSLRNQPGVVTTSKPLPSAKDGWMRGSDGNAGLVPAELAQTLEGRQFSNFASFRSAFWKAAADVPEIAQQTSGSNLKFMQAGYAPTSPDEQHYGSQSLYVLHHKQPIAQGGAVYDLSNIAVMTPAMHQAALDTGYHFGGGSR